MARQRSRWRALPDGELDTRDTGERSHHGEHHVVPAAVERRHHDVIRVMFAAEVLTHRDHDLGAPDQLGLGLERTVMPASDGGMAVDDAPNDETLGRSFAHVAARRRKWTRTAPTASVSTMPVLVGTAPISRRV